MNLLKTLAPIAAGIGAGYFLGGGSTGTAGEGLTGELARSFLASQGRSDGSQPFAMIKADARRPRPVKQLTRGAAVPAQLQPVQQLVSQSPRLETAMRNLYSNGTNAQVRDMFGMYAQDMSTLKQGRRTLTTEQPRDIQVGV